MNPYESDADASPMSQQMTVEWVRHTATHEVSVTLSESSLTRDAYYFVGVDCIDPATDLHMRATTISRHAERQDAIRHAERLAEIINWKRDDQ